MDRLPDVETVWIVAPSREAAEECSPPRQRWVAIGKRGRALAGRKSSPYGKQHFIKSVALSPAVGSWLSNMFHSTHPYCAHPELKYVSAFAAAARSHRYAAPVESL